MMLKLWGVRLSVIPIKARRNDMAENTTNTTTTRRYEGVVYMRTLIAEEAKNTEDYLKSYIGETTDWNTRQQKWYQANNKNYGGKKIQVARDKYGVSDDAWATVILERNYSEVSIDDLEKKLKARETEKIYEYDTVNNGFNGSYGDGMKGRKHTDKSRKLISKNHRNYQSDDAKVKIKAYQQEHGTKLIALAPDGTEACYNTIKDAAKITGVPYSKIHNILNKGNKGEKWGYIFKKV